MNICCVYILNEIKAKVCQTNQAYWLRGGGAENWSEECKIIIKSNENHIKKDLDLAGGGGGGRETLKQP